MISVLINPADRSPVQNNKARQIIESFLKKKKIDNVVVSLKFADSLEMKDLNKRYRGLDEPTTILTFSQETKKGQAFPKPLKILGDMVICLDEAKKKDLSLEELIIHGLKNLINERPNLLPQISTAKN